MADDLAATVGKYGEAARPHLPAALKGESMGGRFGKYGDAKRKARLRKSGLRPPEPRQRGRKKTSGEGRKKKRPGPILDTTIPSR